MRYPSRESPTATELEAGRDLIESEALRHEAGATMLPFDGGVIAITSGDDGRTLDAVVQRVRLAAIHSTIDEWLENIRQRLASLGAPDARILLAASVYHIEAALRHHGYAPRSLHALVAPTSEPAGPPISAQEDLSAFIGHRFVLQAVADDQDWSDLAALQAGTGPASVVELMRRKVEAGFLHPYLAWHEDRLCGTFSVAPAGRVLRLDHVAAAPPQAIGERGLHLAVLRAALTLAAEGGWAYVGSLLAGDAPLLPVYRKAGFIPVGRLTEWERQ